MAQIDDTVRLKGKFHSWSGNAVNADSNVVVKIFDKEQSIIEEITEGIVNVDVGEYHYDYTIPNGMGYLTYGFYCDIGGKPAARKGRIPRTWDSGGK